MSTSQQICQKYQIPSHGCSNFISNCKNAGLVGKKCTPQNLLVRECGKLGIGQQDCRSGIVEQGYKLCEGIGIPRAYCSANNVCSKFGIVDSRNCNAQGIMDYQYSWCQQRRIPDCRLENFLYYWNREQLPFYIKYKGALIAFVGFLLIGGLLAALLLTGKKKK